MTSLQAQVAQLGSGTICNNAHENNSNLILLQASPVSNDGHVLNHHHANSQSDGGLSTHHNIVSDQNHMPHMNSYQVSTKRTYSGSLYKMNITMA